MNPLSKALSGLFLILWLSGPVLAQTAFLESEREIFAHDKQLNLVAGALEDWLSGRMPQNDFLKVLKSARKKLESYRSLPKSVGSKLHGWEVQLLRGIEQFALTDSPDARGQKSLFLSLSKLTESRTTELLRWRQETLAGLLQKKLSDPQRTYFKWETAWIDIWTRETALTGELERAFLEDGSGHDPQQILKSFLKLTAQAAGVACPSELAGANATARERLTLLTRTAEQLVRLNKRRSSGALTRVRRLSRQLSEITSKFQAERLSRLETLI